VFNTDLEVVKVLASAPAALDQGASRICGSTRDGFTTKRKKPDGEMRRPAIRRRPCHLAISR